uniref:NADH dehydrogenase subunit 6 n=1 Tax=Phyllonorycter ringoniella TaxID=571297 RepID=UPI001FA761C9|nr:NADH dehydrogenase subunit 6 [Phyllonorycter ringoniella]ULF47727.1 NADH dehydrogenase subunit 6 [Phyllonorycter ringoniella]
MLKMYISFMLLLISLIMIFINHPLFMGLLILTQTLLICLISGMMINSYWFSYILFLTFLGGLLVLFIYVSSMASNEMFSKIFNMTFFILLTFMISCMLMMMIFKLNQMNWLNFNFNYEMNNMFYNFIHFNNENKINLTELYNSYSYLMMLMMINYLFFTLIVVVKITNIFYGPIRSNIF